MTRIATIENVELSIFRGKQLRDMDRQELLAVLVWAVNDRAHWVQEAKDCLEFGKTLGKGLGALEMRR